MTQPTDSLEAAQRAVPMSCGVLPGGNHSGHHACWPDYPALASAARKWIKAHLISEIERWDKEWGQADEDGLAALLAGITKASGL